MTRPATRRLSVALAFSLLVASAVATGAGAKSPTKPPIKSLSASCAGDTISGKARFSGAGKVKLSLMAKASAKAAFAPTGKARTLVVAKAGNHPYTFNIAALNAYGYRVEASKTVRSKSLLAAACAPGYQIPEAPFALLLPISLLLTIGLPVLLMRRRANPLAT